MKAKASLLILGAFILVLYFLSGEESDRNPSQNSPEHDQPPLLESRDNFSDSQDPSAGPPPVAKGVTVSSPSPGQEQILTEQVRAPAPKLITIESAAEGAWPTADYANHMFKLTELSENRPPPKPGDATVFRGFFWKSGSENSVFLMEMRFVRDKWIVSTGESQDQLRPWPPRDVIPFHDRPDEWTVYLDSNEGLFLKHFPKVSIPELNSEFEVLSGWLMTRNPPTATHVALIGTHDIWPPEALTIRLFPTRPKH